MKKLFLIILFFVPILPIMQPMQTAPKSKKRVIIHSLATLAQATLTGYATYAWKNEKIYPVKKSFAFVALIAFMHTIVSSLKLYDAVKDYRALP